MTNGVMNGAMNRKVLFIVGPVAGFVHEVLHGKTRPLAGETIESGL